MIRFLDGLALLREVDDVKGISYNSVSLRKKHPDKIVVIRHSSYVYREVLCDISSKLVTNLDDYVPLGELAESMKINKRILFQRIDFMEKTGTKLFDYKNIKGMIFIKLDAEFKYLFQNFQPFYAGICDRDNFIHCKLLGEMPIGFY
jgi:hypothetical protein